MLKILKNDSRLRVGDVVQITDGFAFIGEQAAVLEESLAYNRLCYRLDISPGRGCWWHRSQLKLIKRKSFWRAIYDYFSDRSND